MVAGAVFGDWVGKLRALRSDSIDWKYKKISFADPRFQGRILAPTRSARSGGATRQLV
jgi:hypothetical protein